jgi:hypothetical protein
MSNKVLETPILSGRNGVIIGSFNKCTHDKCVLIGNGLESTNDYCLIIGNAKVQATRTMNDVEFRQLVDTLRPYWSYVRLPAEFFRWCAVQPWINEWPEVAEYIEENGFGKVKNGFGQLKDVD